MKQPPRLYIIHQIKSLATEHFAYWHSHFPSSLSHSQHEPFLTIDGLDVLSPYLLDVRVSQPGVNTKEKAPHHFSLVSFQFIHAILHLAQFTFAEGILVALLLMYLVLVEWIGRNDVVVQSLIEIPLEDLHELGYGINRVTQVTEVRLEVLDECDVYVGESEVMPETPQYVERVLVVDYRTF